MTHLLTGVGILKSTIGASNMGYEDRYTLPGQRAALDAYLQPEIDRQNAANQVQMMVSAVYRAINLELEGANELSERVFFLQDESDTEDRDEIIAEFDAFAEEHPEILEESEEEEEDEYESFSEEAAEEDAVEEEEEENSEESHEQLQEENEEEAVE